MKHYLTCILLVIFFFAIFTKSVQAASIYYVSTTGSDSNLGTQIQPFKTIQHAADTVSAGDTVYIGPGIYHELINLTHSGSATGGYITFSAIPGSQCQHNSTTGRTDCSVILDGTQVAVGNNSCGSGTMCGGLFNIYGQGYIKINGIKIRNTHLVSTAPALPYIAGFYIKGANHIYLDNNMTENTASSGIGVWKGTVPSQQIFITNNVILNAQNYDVYTASNGDRGEEDISLDSVSDFSVSHNEIYNDPNDSSLNFNLKWALGICIKSSSQNGSVDHNYIHSMPNGSIYIDGWQAGLNGTTVLNNIQVYDNKAKDISVSGECGGTVDTVWIYNNDLTLSGFSGIDLTSVIGWQGNNRCNPGNGLRKNIYILNNSISETTDYDGSGIEINTANIENIVVKNNVVTYAPYASPSRGVGEIIASTNTPTDLNNMLTQITTNHNLIYGTPPTGWCPCLTWNNSTNHCDAYFACKAISEYPVQIPTTSQYADPMYVNRNPGAGNLNLHLQSGSPAIGKGMNLADYYSQVPSLAYDFDGNPRPSGTNVDIGAYEYNVATTPSPTPTYLPGDINKDHVVNVQDYILLSNAFGTSNAAADINSDGTVNVQDYIILSNNFGKSN